MVQASWLSSSSAWTHSLAVSSVRHTHTHSLSLSFSHTVISICAPCGVNWRCDKAYQQQNSVPYWRRSAAVARSTCTAHIIMTPANVLNHVKSSYTFILSCKFTAERCLIWKWLLCELCFIHRYTIDNRQWMTFGQDILLKVMYMLINTADCSSLFSIYWQQTGCLY